MSQNTRTLDHLPPVEPPYWQAWGLIKQELIFLCWALMELAIIAPFAMFVMDWTQLWSTSQLTLWLLLLILLPFSLVRFLSAIGLDRKRLWRALLITLSITLIICWRGLLYAPRPALDTRWLVEFVSHLGDLRSPLWGRDLVVFIFILLAWWRGLRLAQMTPDIHRIGYRLRAGVLLLAPVSYLLHSQGKLWGATPFVLLYFLAGLTAVALIRAEQIERERSGFAASLTPGRLATIFASSLLVVMTAALLAAIISGETTATITGRLASLWSAVLTTLAVSLSTLMYLLTPVINLLTFLIGLLVRFIELLFASTGIEIQALQAVDLGDLQLLSQDMSDTNSSGFALPHIAGQILAVLAMVMLATTVVYFLTRFFRQPLIAAPAGEKPTHQAARTRGLGDLGERLMKRLGFGWRWRTEASIRRIYSDMCVTAADAGYPRIPAETPYEYLGTLHALWANNMQEVALITEAYIRIRYGEIPETADELEAIGSAWSRLAAIPLAAEEKTPT